MAEQDLGLAVLRLTVDAREAEAQLTKFRSLVNSRLTGLGDGLFDNIIDEASTAGKKAGDELTKGVKNATKSLKFDNAFDALQFNPGNSVKGLEEYARALRRLRDASELGQSSTQALTDRLSAVDAALRTARQSTAQSTAEQQRFNDALDKEVFRRFQADARQFSANLRAQAIETRLAAQALQQYREQAEGAAKALAGLAAKGAVEALKLPLFGVPKGTRGIVNDVISQVQTLRKQAETASGKTARLTEGLAVLGAGGFAAKGIVDTLGGVGGTAESVARSLASVQDRLNALPGALRGLGGLDDLFANASESIQSWATSILQAQGDLSTLSAPLQAVTDALGAMGPEATAIGGALAFTFAGFQDLIARKFKPGVDGARQALKGMTDDTQALLEALARVSEASAGAVSLNDLLTGRRDAMARAADNPVGSEANAEATREVVNLDKRISEEKSKQFYLEQSLLRTSEERLRVAEALRRAADTSSNRPLALPSSDMLNAEGRGIRQLQPQTGPAIDVGLQDARNFTSQLIAAAAAGEQLPPIFSQVERTLQSLADITQEQTLGLRVQNELLADQLALVQQQRALEAQRSQDARARLQQQADIRKQNRLDLAAEELSRRNADRQRAEKGRTALNKRIGEGVGSGLIGGAFPALFGQGLGASIGGGAGGLLGGLKGGQFGFGLSLVGTAIGAQFDEALRKGQLLAAGLDDPIGKFQELRDAALLSSTGLEKQAEALINSGRGAEAAALIQEDLNKRFGDTSGLDELRSAFDEVGRAFSQLSVITTKFVAGPLSDFLNKLAASLMAQSNKALLDERVAGLSASQKQQVEANRNTVRRSLVGQGLTRAEAANALYEEQLAFIDQIAGKTQAAAAIEADKNAAADRYNKLKSISYRLVDAESFGNKKLVLDLQKQQIEQERLNRLAELGSKASPAAIEQINSDAAKKTYDLTQQTARLERERWANGVASANRIADIQGQIAIESKRGVLSDIGVGALQAVEQVRAAIRAEQNAQAAMRVSPGDEGLLNASREAAANTQLAAAKAKQSLLDAFKAAKDAVRAISRSVQDASLKLLQNQGGNDGLNRYLSGQALYNNQQLAYEQILPRFLRARELAARDAERNGNPYAASQFRNLSFSGSYAGVNQAMTEFIDAQRTQERLQEDLATSNYELTKANNSVAEVNRALAEISSQLWDSNTQLATSIETLASKDWNIQVNVASNGTATAYGATLNSAITQ